MWLVPYLAGFILLLLEAELCSASISVFCPVCILHLTIVIHWSNHRYLTGQWMSASNFNLPLDGTSTQMHTVNFLYKSLHNLPYNFYQLCSMHMYTTVHSIEYQDDLIPRWLLLYYIYHSAQDTTSNSAQPDLPLSVTNEVEVTSIVFNIFCCC